MPELRGRRHRGGVGQDHAEPALLSGMSRSVLPRDSSTTSDQNGHSTHPSERRQSSRLRGHRNPPRGRSARHVETMPPHQPMEPGEQRRSLERVATGSPGMHEECRVQSSPESPLDLQPVPSPVSEPLSSPEPEPERRQGSPERPSRSASPEPASRLARRAKRQRRLHGEATPVAAEGPASRPVRSARRCLFGRPDPAELDRSLREERQAIHRADSLRWNFDFEREVPLRGQWQWERVTPGGADGRGRTK